MKSTWRSNLICCILIRKRDSIRLDEMEVVHVVGRRNMGQGVDEEEEDVGRGLRLLDWFECMGMLACSIGEQL